MTFVATRDPRSSAFTLVELLTAIAVLAILMTITIGAVRGAKERAAIAQARAELAALATALEEYKRLYGDYPQLGEFAQAPATPSGKTANLPNGTGPGPATAQARLFNCLTGVFGPRAFAATDRINGPNLLPPQFADTTRLNGSLTAQYLVPVVNPPNPPAKAEQNVSLLDPWGHRYIYYYKNARNSAQWQVAGYVLYSAGRMLATNGTQTPTINPLTGLPLATQTAEMADNIYTTL